MTVDKISPSTSPPTNLQQTVMHVKINFTEALIVLCDSTISLSRLIGLLVSLAVVIPRTFVDSQLPIYICH